MKNNVYVKRSPSSVNVVGEHDFLASENVSANERIVSRSVYKTDSPSRRYLGVDANSFLLENQIAAGTDLKECRLGTDDFVAMHQVDVAERKMSKLESEKGN